MYTNIKELPVKPYLEGLGQTQIDPETHGAATGSVFVFVFTAPTSLPTDTINKAMKDLMGVGKEWWKFIFGSTTYEIQGAGYSNGQIRIWVYFKSAEKRAIAELIPIFKSVLDKDLGGGVASYSKTLLISGSTTDVQQVLQKLFQTVNPFGDVDLQSLLTIGIVVIGGIVVLPKVLEIILQGKKR